VRLGIVLGLLAAGLASGSVWWHQVQVRQSVETALPQPPPLTREQTRLEAALEEATRRARSGSTAVAGLGELALLYHANGYLGEALQAYGALETIDPGEPRWPHLAAVILAGYGDFEPAMERWHRVLERAPEYLAARLRLAEAALKVNQSAKAERLYQEVLRAHPEEPYALLGLARLDFEAGRWEAALPRLEQVVRLTEYQLGYDLIVSAYERLGRTREAEAVRAKMKASGAFREAPDPWYDALVDVCFDPYRIAIAAGTRRDPAVARKLLLRAIEFAPDEVAYRLQLVTHDTDQKAFDAALAGLGEMTRRSPDFADGWAHLSALQKQLGDDAGAARTLVAGLRHCPDSPGLRLMWGSTLRRQGRAEEAVRELERSIELRPDEAAAYVELGHVYVGIGEEARGLALLSRALEVEPGNPAAITFLTFHAISVSDQTEADRGMENVARQPRIGTETRGYLEQAYQQTFGRGWKSASKAE
jgi:tetratricopeptide (TPR) repeat protein